MKCAKIFLIIFLLTLGGNNLWSQEKGLVHFKFPVSDKSQVDTISTLISIDRYKDSWAEAYANTREMEAFKKLDIPYTIIEPLPQSKSIIMATTLEEIANWDKYPTYDLYETLMQHFATTYPEICRLEEMGTLPSGRKLLALKIGLHVSETDVAKPQLFLTSTMHGDETGGYSVLFQLADYMLSHYNQAGFTEVTNLINNAQLWINPLANPNGTYRGGNETVASAIRYNANLVDINRNFPDPATGDHPDGNSWQEETELMIAFANKHHINLAMNLHGGSELINYPWDTWSRPTADDAWWVYVGGNYRDSVQANSPTGYFTDVSDGLSNGYDWYRITGGRQDYMNYFQHCREVTAEISSTKLYPSEQLPDLFQYNKAALLGYLTEGLHGIHGTVKNALGQPLAAKIEVLNHDEDNSEVYTSEETGFFARYLKAGTYTLKISAAGYADAFLTDITINDGEKKYYSLILGTPESRLCADADTIKERIAPEDSASNSLPLLNCGNQMLLFTAEIQDSTVNSWVKISKNSGQLNPSQSDSLWLQFSAETLLPGTYETALILDADSVWNIPIKLVVETSNNLEISKSEFKYKLVQEAELNDSFWLKNQKESAQNVTLTSEAGWLQINPDQVNLGVQDSIEINLQITGNLDVGGYMTKLTLQSETQQEYPVYLSIDTIPLLNFIKDSLFANIVAGETHTDSVFIDNAGGGALDVFVAIPESDTAFIQCQTSAQILASRETKAFVFKINTANQDPGPYLYQIPFMANGQLVYFRYFIEILSPPVLQISTDTLKAQMAVQQLKKEGFWISNKGGSKLNYQISFDGDTQPDWFITHTVSGTIPAQDSIYWSYGWDSRNSLPGIYESALWVNEQKIPLQLIITGTPWLTIEPYGFVFNSATTDTLKLLNSGDGLLKYEVDWFKTPVASEISINKTAGQLAPQQSDIIIITVKEPDWNTDYSNKLILKTSAQTIRIPITVGSAPPARK